MPTGFKLTYFDLRARGETARMLFKLGSRPFEDVRVLTDDWPELKPKTPLGQLPILEKDGHVLAQSNAINRFLAKRFGLAGKTVLDEAYADMVVDTINDAAAGVSKVLRASEEDKADAIQAFIEVFDKGVAQVEGLLEKNNGGEGYFVGNGLTWADVAVYNIIEFANAITDGARWDNHPMLQAFKQRFESEPIIAKHLETRPPAPM